MKLSNKIVDTLNYLLSGELTAVDQYLAHGEKLADLGFEKLANHILHESEHEKEHAQQIIQRILFLEGEPNLQARLDYNIQTTVEDMLKADLAYEYATIQRLRDAISVCEQEQDFVTRDMLVTQLEDSEIDHAYFLEKQLRLIEQVGLGNYLQTQICDPESK